jgi:hypothetical protein
LPSHSTPTSRRSAWASARHFQHYAAEVHLRIPGREELVTIYPDAVGPVGLPASKVHALAARAALAEVPDGQVVGPRVSTDANWH